MTRDKVSELIEIASTQDEIRGALSTLTLSEQAIIEILIHQKHALSIGEIRNTFIYAMYSHILSIAAKSGIIASHKNPYFPGLIKKPPRLTNDALKNLIGLFRKIPGTIPEYKRLKLLNKIFSKHHIQTIGDTTIAGKLDNLMREGLIHKRATLSTSKSLAVYYLIPKVRDKLSEILKKSG